MLQNSNKKKKKRVETCLSLEIPKRKEKEPKNCINCSSLKASLIKKKRKKENKRKKRALRT